LKKKEGGLTKNAPLGVVKGKPKPRGSPYQGTERVNYRDKVVSGGDKKSPEGAVPEMERLMGHTAFSTQ